MQYVPMKPIKKGIKVRVLGDSRTIVNLRFKLVKNNSPEHSLEARVMTSDLKGKHHHVYFDNFFTLIKLIEDIQSDGIMDVEQQGQTGRISTEVEN